jgi:hypothetical protein
MHCLNSSCALAPNDFADPDRRGVYLQRIEAMLKLRHRFNDNDVVEISKLALCGLVHRDTECGLKNITSDCAVR